MNISLNMLLFKKCLVLSLCIIYVMYKYFIILYLKISNYSKYRMCVITYTQVYTVKYFCVDIYITLNISKYYLIEIVLVIIIIIKSQVEACRVMKVRVCLRNPCKSPITIYKTAAFFLSLTHTGLQMCCFFLASTALQVDCYFMLDLGGNKQFLHSEEYIFWVRYCVVGSLCAVVEGGTVCVVLGSVCFGGR